MDESEGGSFFIQATLPETNILAPENGCLEYERFLLGWPIFRGELLVSGSVWYFKRGILYLEPSSVQCFRSRSMVHEIFRFQQGSDRWGQMCDGQKAILPNEAQ